MAPRSGMREVLLAAGEVGRDLLAVDWSATPLGPPHKWPRSLQTVVRMMLASRFSMWMAWGPELTFLCNDSYRRDTLGKKYPWALGRPAHEVWSEIWSDIGPRIGAVLETGEATWDEGLQLFLERSGYVEETYHTFSYSPLAGDNGAIAGMLCVVSEETERVIAERRMAILRDLSAALTGVRREDELFAAAARQLDANVESLPFTLTYLDDEEAPRLVCASGFAGPHPIMDPTTWGTDVVQDLAGHVGLPTGGWPEPPVQALVLPLADRGSARPFGFVVMGLNRYRPLDDDYRGFADLIAGQLAAAIASARAYDAERRRAEALAELDRAKTTFFTNISHEFRTPLTLLLGPAEDALADDAAAEALAPVQRERIEMVNRNAQRLLKLVNTLLDFSRLESGQITGYFEPTDLPRYTAELAAMFSRAIERAGLALTVDCAPMPDAAFVDREMWAKIVLNLLSNALKFTFTGGIRVSLRAAGDVAELTVVDSGIGIPTDELPHLFERFHRVLGAQSRSHEGSGIGLALVAELAQLHGGSVDASSVPGEGSVFRVRIPLGSAHLATVQLARAGSTDRGARDHAETFLAEADRWHGSAPPAAEPVAARPYVLVVDDNADMRQYISALLSEHYRVRTAADGAEALQLARVEPPDLVLTDVMMPVLDGFGLLAALRADPATAPVPVVMLSARAGDEATVEGLDAGADDYLVKPFSTRELLARVRANLELDRVRRTRDELVKSQFLLDQAQRLAGVGSWELDLVSGGMTASNEFLRQVGFSAGDLSADGYARMLSHRVHPDDVPLVRAAVDAAVAGAPLDYEVRLVDDNGSVRIHHTIGELVRHLDGHPLSLRGSNQDITEQRSAEQALAAAAASQVASAREHRIADELQRSLLPEPRFEAEHLDLASYYRAGVEGTQVGGDWYDLIELGADRTALVMGDVMGRGVRAAAVMGQLRAAVRAYARLDLTPADVLEFLDGVVRDIAADQIVTCVYAVFDPGDGTLSYANAGHLPPLLCRPGEPPVRLEGALGPPLGTGPIVVPEQQVQMTPGDMLVLYTDGLVERRDSDLDAGIDSLAVQLEGTGTTLDALPDALVEALLPDGPDDDIAILLARVSAQAQQTTTAVRHIAATEEAVPQAREFVASVLADWRLRRDLVDDILLVASELITNAVLHGRPPITLRLRRTDAHLVIEVNDAAPFMPRKLRPAPQDEHGRGLQLVSQIADRWGARPTTSGKSVWCVFAAAGG